MKAICAEEVEDLKHLLYPPATRTFDATFYAALEARILAYAVRLLKAAAMFARSRDYAIKGEVSNSSMTTLCAMDLHHAQLHIALQDQE
jgi:hypothetical protein